MKFLQIIADVSSDPYSFQACDDERSYSEWANITIPYPYRQPGKDVIGGIEFKLIGCPATQSALHFVDQFAPLLDGIWHKFSDHIFEIV